MYILLCYAFNIVISSYFHSALWYYTLMAILSFYYNAVIVNGKGLVGKQVTCLNYLLQILVFASF